MPFEAPYVRRPDSVDTADHERGATGRKGMPASTPAGVQRHLLAREGSRDDRNGRSGG